MHIDDTTFLVFFLVTFLGGVAWADGKPPSTLP